LQSHKGQKLPPKIRPSHHQGSSYNIWQGFPAQEVVRPAGGPSRRASPAPRGMNRPAGCLSPLAYGP
jgi:hypothetical protein